MANVFQSKLGSESSKLVSNKSSSILALTTGVGPLTTKSQYTAASINGTATMANIVLTVGLKIASPIRCVRVLGGKG